MIVALCQMNIVWENKKENIRKVKTFVKEAALKKSDIVLLPEMSLTGFSPEIENTKEINESVEEIKNIAINNGIAIGIGWTRDCGNKGENVYTVVNDKGEVISEYTKIHPFSYSGEDINFISGDSIATFEYKGFRIGTLICYDLRFPEIFQALSKDADLIIVPACWPQKRREHWKTLLKARAIENQCYIAGVNCVGNIGGLYYSGDSMVINPNGDVLNSTNNSEGLIIVDLNNDVYDFREEFPTKKDRKTLLYKELL